MRRSISTSPSVTTPAAELLAVAQDAAADDDGVFDLLEGEGDQALWRPARLVEHVDQQFQLGLGLDAAVLGDALDQPGGVGGGQVAFGLGLVDDVVGDGLDEAVGPGGVLHRAGIVEGEDGVGFFGGDVAVVVVAAPQLQHVGVLDAAARLDFRHRNRAQNAHGRPPKCKAAQTKGEAVTIPLMRGLEAGIVATLSGSPCRRRNTQERCSLVHLQMICNCNMCRAVSSRGRGARAC